MQPFRLTLLEEVSFSERWQIPVTRLGVLLVVSFLSLSLVVLTYGVVARTALKEYVIPGYVSESSRTQAILAAERVDSLRAIIVLQSKYLEDLRAVLKGETEIFELVDLAPDSSEHLVLGSTNFNVDVPLEDAELRSQIESEDRFALRRGAADLTSNRGIPFMPLTGTVSSNYDAVSGHLGIDIVAPEGSIIHAVDDGVVMLATYTVDGGYVISIQHDHNRVSVYKHNKSLLFESGDHVRVGDPIAVLGGTGTHSTGPHSHFEWWVGGQPLDPAQWLPTQGAVVTP